jgi:hypothetical protein
VKAVYIYYVLLAICFLYSLYFLYDNKVKVLAILLFLSCVTETIVQYKINHRQHYYQYYFYFTLAEYPCISLVLFQCIRSTLVRVILVCSIPLFDFACILINYYLQGLNQLPGISGGLEGLLIIIWCLRAFYDIEVTGPDTLFQQPSLWFIMAFYSYYCIVTVFDSVFNTLQADPKFLVSSTTVYAVINNAANYLLYILCMVGLSCLKRTKFMRLAYL